jgi:hypothetical protein
MRVRALAAAALTLAALAVPAHATGGAVLTDPCGDGYQPPYDVARTDFLYSSTGFQVHTENCGRSTLDGNWAITVHLTSFTPEVTITSAVTDESRGSYWSGFYLCQGDTECAFTLNATPPSAFVPPGTRLAGSDYYDDVENPGLSGRAAFGYGGWADLLPGVTIPDTIDFYVTTYGPTLQYDRAPDVGVATAERNTVTRATHVEVAPVPTVTWQPIGVLTEVHGVLTYADGATLPNRFATLYTPAGVRWGYQFYGGVDFDSDHAIPEIGYFSTFAEVSANTTFDVSFDGDGIGDPSSRPTARALVSAFVSLDLPAKLSVRRGATVRFHGVVRPKEPNTSVLVQARSGGPGTAWRSWRTVPLATGPDTYYQFTWTPSNTGTTTFRVLWQHGSTADGDVVNGMSNYATITVS